jgi:hypothetical protein
MRMLVELGSCKLLPASPRVFGPGPGTGAACACGVEGYASRYRVASHLYLYLSLLLRLRAVASERDSTNRKGACDMITQAAMRFHQRHMRKGDEQDGQDRANLESTASQQQRIQNTIQSPIPPVRSAPSPNHTASTPQSTHPSLHPSIPPSSIHPSLPPSLHPFLPPSIPPSLHPSIPPSSPSPETQPHRASPRASEHPTRT